jgi:hypothetical protein
MTHPFFPLSINEEKLPTHRGVAMGGTMRLVSAERDYGCAFGEITAQDGFCCVYQGGRDTSICDAKDRHIRRTEKVGQGVDCRVFRVIECAIDI